MTTSLCLNCAAFKEGPWSPCPSCGFQPNHPDDLVGALALSEDKFSHDQLQEMSRQHRPGERWKVDPLLVRACRTQIETMGMQRIPTEEEKQAKLPWPRRAEEDPEVALLDMLVSISIIGFPLLPLEFTGRGVVKFVTLGTVSCHKDLAWMFGLLFYLVWFAGICLFFAGR